MSLQDEQIKIIDDLLRMLENQKTKSLMGSVFRTFVNIGLKDGDPNYARVLNISSALKFIPSPVEVIPTDAPFVTSEQAIKVLEKLISSHPKEKFLNSDGRCPSCSEKHENLFDYIVRVFGTPKFIINNEAQPTTNNKESRSILATTPAAEATTNGKTALKFKDVGVNYTKDGFITLPENMTYDEAVEWIQRRKAESEKEVSIQELIDAHPLEGAYALHQVLEAKFGFTDLVGTPGFFGLRPPKMFSLEVGVGKTVMVPWGRIELPALPGGYIQCGADLREGDVVFSIAGLIKQKHKTLVQEVVDSVRERVRTHSLYKGQAIYLNFPPTDDAGNPQFNINDAPKFMDLVKSADEVTIFTKETEEEIQSSILTPIQKSAHCRKHQIPLKRGVLLEGPFGVGKTLTANLTARASVENNWTFLYLKNPAELARAIKFAAKYQPAVIFMEDVDRVFDGDRDVDMDTMLNTLDGIDSKKNEVITIFTTNDVASINKAALRPGRLDAVISVRAPNAVAVSKLIRHYSRGTISVKEDLTEVSQKLADQQTTPAVIREVVERSKLAAVSRSSDDSDTIAITAKDLLVVTRQMLNHLELLKEVPEDNRTNFELLGDALGSHIAVAMKHYPLQGNKVPRAKLVETSADLSTVESENGV